MLAEIHERDEVLHDAATFIAHRTDEDGCKKLASILPAEIDLRIAFGAALERGGLSA
jgi:hypothetical protein